jgi:hypothetical protein
MSPFSRSAPSPWRRAWLRRRPAAAAARRGRSRAGPAGRGAGPGSAAPQFGGRQAGFLGQVGGDGAQTARAATAAGGEHPWRRPWPGAALGSFALAALGGALGEGLGAAQQAGQATAPARALSARTPPTAIADQRQDARNVLHRRPPVERRGGSGGPSNRSSSKLGRGRGGDARCRRRRRRARQARLAGGGQEGAQAGRSRRAARPALDRRTRGGRSAGLAGRRRHRSTRRSSSLEARARPSRCGRPAYRPPRRWRRAGRPGPARRGHGGGVRDRPRPWRSPRGCRAGPSAAGPGASPCARATSSRPPAGPFIPMADHAHFSFCTACLAWGVSGASAPHGDV